jgi:hypothetical protein
MSERWVTGSTSRKELDVSSTRASYRVFPTWSSRFWTWLTGKPDGGQQPLIRLTPLTYAVSTVATYLVGLALATIASPLSGAWSVAALLMGWTLVVNGARRMVSTVAHQCIHRRFTGNVRVDFFVANCIAVLTLTQSAKDYHEEHFRLHHHHAVFSSSRDPAAAFLLQAGFQPGMAIDKLWRRLAVTLVSPRFHARFLWSRIRSLFSGLSLTGGLIGVCFWAAIYIFAVGWRFSPVGFAALIVPLTVLYQNSVLLEFISEHAWFVNVGEVEQPKYIHATHSWGRFCGRQTPTGDGQPWTGRAVEWVLWALEHIFYHMPVRLVILPGDLSQHDFHHRNPATARWTEATFAREVDVEFGDSRWPAYREFWGLHNAIKHVFNGISKAQL